MITMISILSVVLVAAGVASFQYHDSAWNSWKEEYNRQYRSSVEELYRRAVFESNMKFVEEHNQRSEEFGFVVGMNEFADMNIEEFSLLHNGLLQKYDDYDRANKARIPLDNKDLPKKMDWRESNVVTPVKNQGGCGSCWAFSATGSLEGQHAIMTGDLVSLSEQQLVDCAGGVFHNHGCKGGWTPNAFKYIASVKGDDTEKSYPYTAKNLTCKYSPAKVGAGDGGSQNILRGSEEALQEAVANVGPISLAIDAGHHSFQLYKSGVYNETKCSSTRLDHGVLAVGYGTYEKRDYWLVKNSWGERWGNKGYIMMSRNKNNQCGIATAACYPILVT